MVGAVNGEDELAKQDAVNLLEAIAEAAVQIEAETPAKERKTRKKKDDVEADEPVALEGESETGA